MLEKFPKFNLRDSLNDLDIIEVSELASTKNNVILDTNFLFVTFQFKIDVISEISRLTNSNPKLFIFQGTIDELCAIEKKGDKNKKYLKLISKFLHVYKIKVIKSNRKYIDDVILSNLDKGVSIATNDKELKEKIQKELIRVIFMRQESYLDLK